MCVLLANFSGSIYRKRTLLQAAVGVLLKQVVRTDFWKRQFRRSSRGSNLYQGGAKRKLSPWFDAPEIKCRA
jgi:hypothetical protein